MNNYIMKTVSVNGTEVQFLEALRDFFTTNTVMPFTVESENLTNTDGEANYIKLASDDYKLEFLSPVTTNTNVSALKITMKKNNSEETTIGTQNLPFVSSNTMRDNSTARAYPVFIVKGENLEFINIGVFNSSYGKGSGFFYIKSATSETGYINAFAVSSSNTFSFTDYETNGVFYTLAPYHTSSTSTDTLIMDSELALKEKNTNYYCGTMLDCYGLGGGTKGTFYKDSNGTLLYCFDANACFKLDTKTE